MIYNPPKSLFRRPRFLDHRLQGYLLVALVMLELTMLSIAIGYLYVQYSTLVEASLYRAHTAETPGLLEALLRELGVVVLVMAVVNTLALVAAHLVWANHLNRVVRQFRQRLESIKALVLVSRPLRDADAHPLLRTLNDWQQVEAERLLGIQQELNRLPAPGGRYSQEERARVREILRRARGRLRRTPSAEGATPVR